MVFLTLARRDAVYRRRRSERLVEAHHRCGCVLRNHETAVQTRTCYEEARQTACAADELVDAAFGDVREFAHGYREEVHRHGNRFAVEVAGRDDEVVVGTYGRVVGCRVHLDVNYGVDVCNGVLHRAVNLRDASERIRVLHVRLRFLHNLAALEQLSHASRCDDLSLMRTYLMHSVGERRRESVVGVERHSRNLVCPIAQTMRLQQRPYSERTHVLRAVEQRQTLFRCELDRLPVELLQHLLAANHLAVYLHFAETDERKRKVSQRNEVARCAERALHVYHRIYVVVEEVDESVHGDELAAREAVAERLYLQEQHNLHDVVRHTVARAASMRHHKVYLQLRQVVGADAHVAERAEARRNAVDRSGGLRYLSVEIFSTLHDALLRVVTQFYLVAAINHLANTFD